jgi:Niemann-Pick C1 protein
MVLTYSTLLIAALASCIQFLEVTTDPVKLWSSENSRGRKEKEYYDTQFDPFYRSQQLIIKAEGYEGPTFKGEKWGPAFNQSFLLDIYDLTDYLSNEVFTILLRLMYPFLNKKLRLIYAITDSQAYISDLT